MHPKIVVFLGLAVFVLIVAPIILPIAGVLFLLMFLSEMSKS